MKHNEIINALVDEFNIKRQTIKDILDKYLNEIEKKEMINNMGFSRTKLKQVWDKARDCTCGEEDCHPNNHKLCSICGNNRQKYPNIRDRRMLYGTYFDDNYQYDDKWDIDHIIPKSSGGGDNVENLRAVHWRCNQSKGVRVFLYW